MDNHPATIRNQPQVVVDPSERMEAGGNTNPNVG